MTHSEQYLDILGKMIAPIQFNVTPQVVVRVQNPGSDYAANRYDEILRLVRANARVAMREAMEYEIQQVKIDRIHAKIDFARTRFHNAKTEEAQETYEAMVEDLYDQIKKLEEEINQ